MEIIRYNPDKNIGLNSSQVDERIKNNLINKDTLIKTKTIPQIIIGSTFTLFNMLNIFLAVCIISVGSYKNVLFLGVLICNTIITIIQEIQAKKIIDKLSLVTQGKIKVIRDGKTQEISREEILLDDLIILEAGNQVVVDVIVINGEIEVNESAITGEEKSILKTKNKQILSGSYIVSGYAIAKVDKISEDAYISVISKDAKKMKGRKSEIVKSLNNIIKIISIIIVPLGLLFFYIQYNLSGNTFENAVVNSAAAMLVMIPDGLILLISTVFALGVIRLSRKKILVQNLYCSENLARVDTLCLDKTGTITEGCMEVIDTIPINNIKKDSINEYLCDICYYSKDNNSVMKALKTKYNSESNKKIKSLVAFSSKHKYSGIVLDNNESYIIGAPEFIYKDKYDEIKDIVDNYISDYRVLLLAKSSKEFSATDISDDVKALSLILLQDKIRDDAISTINYFKEQGVNLKIISGDNPVTVASIARRSGFEKVLEIDATTLENDELIKDAVKKYNVFGRVTPFQKKKIVEYLQQDGHVVAFTGDGVNDVLALKQSDCSITIASASDAARNVSELVLLDSDFSKVPEVVADGRRNINNLERSAVLFLTKTMYASMLLLMFMLVNEQYPLIPIQASLRSVATIGIPSFILALEKNEDLVRGKFIINVLKKAIPGAFTVVINIVIITVLNKILNLTNEEVTTFSVILTALSGFLVIYKACIPFNKLRATLLITMVSLFTIEYLLLPNIFQLIYLTPKNIVLLIILSICAIIIYGLLNILTVNMFKKNNKLI